MTESVCMYMFTKQHAQFDEIVLANMKVFLIGTNSYNCTKISGGAEENCNLCPVTV